jgi:hypothetical protein
MIHNILRKRRFCVSILEVFAIACMVTIIEGCGKIDKNQYSRTNAEDKAVNEIVKKLDGCSPSWVDIKADDINQRSKVLDCIKQFSRYDLDILQKALEQYVSIKRKENRIIDCDNIYILNRYIFNVPARIPLGSPGFASFSGGPADSNGIDELWPLSFNDKGNLVLTGVCHGYFGPAYLPVEEFKYFRKNYGIRLHNAIKEGENKK